MSKTQRYLRRKTATICVCAFEKGETSKSTWVPFLDDSFPQKNSPVANHSELHRLSDDLKSFRDTSRQTNSLLSETRHQTVAQLGIQMLLPWPSICLLECRAPKRSSYSHVSSLRAISMQVVVLQTHQVAMDFGPVKFDCSAILKRLNMSENAILESDSLRD